MQNNTNALNELLQVANELPDASSGVSSVFEDVDTLPDNPDEQKIYRLSTPEIQWYMYSGSNGLVNVGASMEAEGATVNIIQVSELPENFEPLMNNNTITIYVIGEDIYGYDNVTGSNTWLSNNELITITDGAGYGGFITSLDTTNLTDGYHYLYSIISYSYINVSGGSQFEFANLTELENNLGVGRKGTGSCSEVFNDYDTNVAASIYSHAEGTSTTALGFYSHAEGKETTASGQSSHAEGTSTTASGESSHSEGARTKALGQSSHAEGTETTASGAYSHAEGLYTTASYYYSHAEGYKTTASGSSSHAEGERTTASGHYSHAEGAGTVYDEVYIFTRTATQNRYTCDSSFLHGVTLTNKNGTYARIIAVTGTSSPYTYTLSKDFVTTTGETVSLYKVVGVASGDYSHAEGCLTTASGYYSHAEGDSTQALGSNSHAEGSSTIASGDTSHAEGKETTASGGYSHAEGHSTKASGNYSHAEGYSTTASYYSSHAEGNSTKASGDGAHAEGYYTTAASANQHVQGKYNIEDSSDKYAHIVGNGENANSRSNAHTLDWDGNAWFKGNIRVGGTSWDDATELGSGGTGGNYDDTEVRGLIAAETTRATQQENLLQQQLNGTTEIANSALSSTNTFSDYMSYAESNHATKAEVVNIDAVKQNKLVSGENIKTINGTSILGSGNIDISGGNSALKICDLSAYRDGDIIASEDAVKLQQSDFAIIMDTHEDKKVIGTIEISGDNYWIHIGSVINDATEIVEASYVVRLRDSDYVFIEDDYLVNTVDGSVDTELSSTSTNPVQNKVIKQALDNQDVKIYDYVSELYYSLWMQYNRVTEWHSVSFEGPQTWLAPSPYFTYHVTAEGEFNIEPIILYQENEDGDRYAFSDPDVYHIYYFNYLEVDATDPGDTMHGVEINDLFTAWYGNDEQSGDEWYTSSTYATGMAYIASENIWLDLSAGGIARYVGFKWKITAPFIMCAWAESGDLYIDFLTPLMVDKKA